LGIASGGGNNMFLPDTAITRQEMFKFLYNILEYLNQLPEAKEGLTIKSFTDVNEVSDWALPALKCMVEGGITNGTGNNKLSPRANAHRATLAQIIYTLFK